MGLIKDETDSGREPCVTTLEDGTEEGNITVEESLDIKEENPKAITFPTITSEPEVSVWGLCVRQLQFVLPRPFTASKRELWKLHFNCLSVCMYNAFCVVYYLDQPMHNIYINNTCLYRNVASFVTLAIRKYE
jgi:hypothetical protein